MAEKLVIGPISKGLRTNLEPFNIDNDSFPVLINAFQWRGRVRRKRGTAPISQSPVYPSRLIRFFNSSNPSYGSITTITLDGSGKGNLFTAFALESSGNVIPTTLTLTGPGGPFTDPTADGYLTPTGTGGNNTINYATGDISIPSQAGSSYSATFVYAPGLPVMGLEDLVITPGQLPNSIWFDTIYAYNVQTTFPYVAYDVSFYVNPPTGTYTNYVQKTNWSPTRWHGQNYQQFWSTNYQGAFWVTNGITVPFTTTNIGMQFKPITGATIIATGAVGPPVVPAVIQLTIAGHGLVVGDFVFLNEIVGMTGVNGQTGYVTTVVNNATVQVTLPFAVIGGAWTSGGIAQYLTSQAANPTLDCIRWYDGDPTSGSINNPTFTAGLGWVNFMPPISNSPFAIGDTPAAVYYLVGARMIQPFKDRLCFLGPVIQSSTGIPIYLQDAVVYSEAGTPYYTASFTGPPSAPTSTPVPILTPPNQTADPRAFVGDIIGFGGAVFAGVNAAICTSSPNQDMLILGFDRHLQTRFAFTGNDIQPFTFYTINSELGSSSTFSTINMDYGVLTRGSRGYIITNQDETTRFDLQTPDQIFEINLGNKGNERVTAVRDYENEWIYFTYTGLKSPSTFPSETFFYNYRDNSFAILYESYTTYGLFRRRTGFTWATVGYTFPTWADWNEPWSDGENQSFNPQVAAGNQQGYMFIRDIGTGEASSLSITSFSGQTVTSPNHGLNDGDYVLITGALGTVGTSVNGLISRISYVDLNTFTLNNITPSGTYFGEGVITRIYQPFIQSKQFPTAWAFGRKTRIGPQQYLFTRTAAGQVTLLIYLSQDAADSWNNLLFPSPAAILPASNSPNDAIIYNTILYTCPESTNLGLTPFNTNLQQLNTISSTGQSANSQAQIWHRMNTSLIGDTVQIGITLSEPQLLNLTSMGIPLTITGATNTNPLVLTINNQLSARNQVLINDVQGMTQLNGNTYIITSASSTSITLNVDATAFGAYTTGGTATQVAALTQFAEIEFHGMVMDVSPSQMLS